MPSPSASGQAAFAAILGHFSPSSTPSSSELIFRGSVLRRTPLAVKPTTSTKSLAGTLRVRVCGVCAQQPFFRSGSTVAVRVCAVVHQGRRHTHGHQRVFVLVDFLNIGQAIAVCIGAVVAADSCQGVGVGQGWAKGIGAELVRAIASYLSLAALWACRSWSAAPCRS